MPGAELTEIVDDKTNWGKGLGQARACSAHVPGHGDV